MSAEQPPEKSPRHVQAAYARWADKTPEQRVAHGRMLSERAKAARDARREAEGKPEPRVKPTSRPMPSALELDPYLEELDGEQRRAELRADAAGEPRPTPLSYNERIQQATFRLRRDVAAQTYRAMQGKK